MAEAARVIKPGGVLVANIRPYIALNQWREQQYRSILEKFFRLEQWQVEQDDQAVAQLTPEIRAELVDYGEAELTCRQVIALARCGA